MRTRLGLAARKLLPFRSAGRSSVSARRSRVGIGGLLGAGLAAVGAVVLIGQILASRTTQAAVEAVRSMQAHEEPLAGGAGAIVEKLAAYDRT
ncbi:MAG: hypothetical protein ACREUG_10950, partial [Steroidobacteraceae bacterium]